MPTKQQIRDQLEQLKLHRGNVQIYRRQWISQGGEAFALPATQRGLAEAYEGIAYCKKILREWEVTVDDEPNDFPYSEENQKEDYQKRLEYFIRVSEEVKNYSNSVTLENQRILSAFLIDTNTRMEIAKDLHSLFHHQENRGSFAQWEAFFQNQINKESNNGIKQILQDMLNTVILLRETIYSNEKQYITKRFLLMQFQKNNDELDAASLQEAIQEYFDKLRSIEERVGRIVGDLQSLLSI
ncbi:MAG: hypothetical protein OHK0022_22210 [Roseiflexaceae bacterium]